MRSKISSRCTETDLRRIDTDTHLIALDAEHCHGDFLTDDNCLSNPSRKYQHGNAPSLWWMVFCWGRPRPEIGETPKRAKRLTVHCAKRVRTAACPAPMANRSQRRRQCCGIGAACLRKIRPATTLAADLRGHHAHDLTGLQAGCEISCYSGHQYDLSALIRRGQHDHCRFQSFLQLIHGIAQRGGIGTFHLSWQPLSRPGYPGRPRQGRCPGRWRACPSANAIASRVRAPAPALPGRASRRHRACRAPGSRHCAAGRRSAMM